MQRVTLTFDNGPEPGVTEGVLDMLAEAGVLATFFVMGRKVAVPEGYRLVERARKAGHNIGNHTFSHSVPLGLSTDAEAPEKEIGKTQLLLGSLDPEKLFRPFGGHGRLGPHLLSPAAVDYLVAGGFTCVTWNVVPGDWDGDPAWVERAIAACSSRDWSLVVLHDLKPAAIKRLPEFLAWLRTSRAEIRQDFPPDCLLIVAGKPTPALDTALSPAPAEPLVKASGRSAFGPNR